MAETEKKQEKKEEESTFKGAFASVLILGSFILISWFGVWSLFLSRG